MELNDFSIPGDDVYGASMSFNRLENSAKDAAGLLNLRPQSVANAAASTTLPADEAYLGPSQPYNAFRQQTPLVPGAVYSTMVMNGMNGMNASARWGPPFSPLSDMAGDEGQFSMPMHSLVGFNGSPTSSFLGSPTQTIQAAPSPSATFGSLPPRRVYPGYHQDQQQRLQQQQQQIPQQQPQPHLQQHLQHLPQQQPQLLLQQPQQHLQMQFLGQQALQQSMSPQDRNMSPDDEGDEGANTNQGARETTPTNGPRRTKKALSEMDDDERLLNSEAAKSMPPKAKRQLRNKVSARNFRTRRKEYMMGIEKENRDLKKENRRYREFINTILTGPLGSQVVQSMHTIPTCPSQSTMAQFPMSQPLSLDGQHLHLNGFFPLDSIENIDEEMSSLVNLDGEDDFDDEVDEDTKPKKK